MGSGEKTVLKCEVKARKFARRSIVSKYNLQKNHKIQMKDLDFKRPGIGINPKEVKKILKLNKNKVHTKLFSYPVNGYFTVEKGKYNLFNCGISRYGLNFFNIFQSNTFNNFSGLNGISSSGINMAELLIPDLNFNLEKDKYMELLTHEGYQLK